MIDITPADVARTRAVLTERAARSETLMARADELGLTDFIERIEWLASQRTSDEKLAWERKWPRGRKQSTPAPTSPLPRMKWPEVIEELEWLLNNGSMPWEAAQAMGRNAEALRKLATRHGRNDLAFAMNFERRAA